MAKHIPPGRRRTYAFMTWPAFRPQQWRHLMQSAEQQMYPLSQPLIFASDLSADACTRLTDCLHRNDLMDAVRVENRDFFHLHPKTELTHLPPGLIVLNPPFHRRLTTGAGLTDFYSRIGAKLRSDFSGWQAGVIIPRADLAGLFPMALRARPLVHGGLNLTLLVGIIP
jgi:putative N6-adenine-specific DNA methylase